MDQVLEQKLAALKQRLAEVDDIRSAGAVLNWDQATSMPAGGAAARSRQLATLSRLAHQKATDVELGSLLDALEKQSHDLPDIDAALVRVARRDFEKANKVPTDFVTRASAHHSQTYIAWTKAKSENDFAAVASHLRQNVEISRDYAEFFRPFQHIADPLIDNADEGVTVSEVRRVFSDLRPALKALIDEISERPKIDTSCLSGNFNKDDQLAFGLSIAEKFGYNLKHGRLDITVHPFCTRFSVDDVRITTRVRDNDIQEALFSTLHEAGHALYEQGVANKLDGTPLGRGASAGLHESQARLWENIVGRSQPFWHHWYPALQSTFPAPFQDVALDTFYKAINRVEPSLIRTDADEVTYNLHVMMRFDLETDLLEGRLDVKDLPEAWRSKMLEDVGVAPHCDREGCLQDVHWYICYIGGLFQGYTIGNVLSAQLYAAAIEAHPEIPADITQGVYSNLHNWLRNALYKHGRRYAPKDMIEKATGAQLQTGPYLDYLRGKFAPIYSLA